MTVILIVAAVLVASGVVVFMLRAARGGTRELTENGASDGVAGDVHPTDPVVDTPPSSDRARRRSS